MRAWALALLLCCPGALRAQEEQSRLERVRALRLADDPAQIPEFARILAEDESDAVRLEALRALAASRHDGPRRQRAMADALLTDLSSELRAAAAAALLESGEPASLEVLEQALPSEQGAGVRRAVCVTLSSPTLHAGHPQATAILLRLVQEDPEAEVRAAAAEALGVRGDRRALGALDQASKDDRARAVRQAAKTARASLAKAAPAKPAPAAKAEPKGGPAATKGTDPCGDGNGWCECGSKAISTKPRCMSREDCRHRFVSAYRPQGYDCRWDGQELE